jgi:hypothetical protein
VEVSLHAFQISQLDGTEWSVSRPGHFTPGTNWIGGCVGSRTGMHVVAKRRKSHHCSCRELNTDHSARSLVAILYKRYCLAVFRFLLVTTQFLLNLSPSHSSDQWYNAGLRAGWSGFPVPEGTENCSLHHRVQTSSGAHLASYPVGTRGSFPWADGPVTSI